MQEALMHEKPANILRVAVDVVLVLETALVRGRQVVAMAAVLLTSGGQCDPPVRPWIIVTICLFGVHVCLVLGWRLVRKYLPQALKTFVKALKYACHAALQIALLVWIILGSVWLFKDFADCADGNAYPDFTGGFVVTLTTIMLYYVLAGLSILLMVFWCIGRGLLTKSQYEEL